MAMVAVPEAAVDQYQGFIGGEYQIGLAGQLPVVQAIAKALIVKQRADQQLGLGILSTDS